MPGHPLPVRRYGGGSSRETKARLGFRLHLALMLGDPRFGVRFRFEVAYLGRVAVKDGYLDAERPVI
jgi:hypothetical protein